MKAYLTFLCLITYGSSYTQSECGCHDELTFAISYIERNLPGYQDNVTAANQSDYDVFKRSLYEQAPKQSSRVNCFKLLTRYVEFFKDNHSRIQMSFTSIDESDSEQVEKFLNSDLFLDRETHDLSSDDLEQFPLEDIRGIYRTQDTAYIIAIVETKDVLRDYIGIIVDSRTPLWKRGQIKLELKKKPTGGYEAFSYLRNHSIQYQADFELHAGILGDSWFKTSGTQVENFAVNENFKPSFTTIDGDVSYLRIPTFSGGWSARLDSLYLAAAKTIERNPYLIIDVRNNGGGSDNNVIPLWKYIYTRPVIGDEVGLYVTADNIRKWEEWTTEISADTMNYSDADVQWFEEEVRKMKKAELGTFIVRSTRNTTTREVYPKKPKKVAILYNKYCASSCESLLFLGKQSDNTILVGENSGGYVGYGEVGATQTPCFKFTLHTSMTRYEDQRAYEVVGVAPDIRLTYDRDWVEQTIDLLKSAK